MCHIIPLRLESNKSTEKRNVFIHESPPEIEEYRRAYAVKQKMEGINYQP